MLTRTGARTGDRFTFNPSQKYVSFISFHGEILHNPVPNDKKNEVGT